MSTGRKRRNPFYKELIAALNAAQREILLTTPYFVPRRYFRRLLYQALDRGVNVSLMLSCHSNLPCLTYGRQASGKLLKRGGKVYLYHRSMMHAKTLVVDDTICAVGSSNLDSLSFFHNREMNLFTSNPGMIEALKAQFQNDRQASRLLTYESWLKRPLTEKLLSLALRPVQHLL